jgi:predicted RNA-binding protein with PUA-like domain
MKIWIVVIEYQRDTPSIAGAFATKGLAEAKGLQLIDEMSGDGDVPYYDPRNEKEEIDWTFNVLVEEQEVQGKNTPLRRA